MLCLQSSCLTLVWAALALLGGLYSMLALSLLGPGVLALILAVILITIGVELIMVRRVMTCQSPVKLSLSSIISVTSKIAPWLPQPLSTSVANCLSGVRGPGRLSLNQRAINWIGNTDFDNIVGKIKYLTS